MYSTVRCLFLHIVFSILLHFYAAKYQFDESIGPSGIAIVSKDISSLITYLELNLRGN